MEVNINWSEFEGRISRLRGDMTKILKVTKEKLEDAAKKSGLPMAFKLKVELVFDDQQS